MPWKDTTMMEQKIEFINEWRSGNFTLSELCRQFDISRPTAYKFIRRYETEGIAGLKEKQRSPHGHPIRTPEEIEERILKLRKQHPRWGGEKIWKLLHRDLAKEIIPCVSTVNRIIKRNGLIIERKRRPRVKPVYPIFSPQACNEVWSADFKGKFRLGNTRYCYPLTIADSYSRYIFAAKGLYGESGAESLSKRSIALAINEVGDGVDQPYREEGRPGRDRRGTLADVFQAKDVRIFR